MFTRSGLEKQAMTWAFRIAKVLDKYATRITKSRSFWYYDSESDSNRSDIDDDEQEFFPNNV